MFSVMARANFLELTAKAVYKAAYNVLGALTALAAELGWQCWQQ
jgi:hypothetical protein